MKRLIILFGALGLIGLIAGVGNSPPAAQAQSPATAGTCQLHANTYWSEEAVGRLYANYPFYLTSAIRKSADWKVLAVFHMMERSLVLDNPGNGQGFMQLYSYVKANPDAFPAKDHLSAEEAVTQLDLAYDEIQGKAKGNLTASPDLEVLYQAAAAYNGLGFHKKWQDHPYVVNDPPNGVRLKKPSRDGGPEDTISQQAGFKPLYESLSAQCPTGSVLLDPRLDSNREAVEHCPTLADPANVFPVATDAAGIANGSDNAGDWLIWTPGAANQHHDYDAGDVHGPTGTPVVSMTAGKVVDVRVGEWSGKTWQPARLRVQTSDGCVLWYQHLLNGSVVVHEGDEVAPGQLLGQVGTPQDAFDTAAHLHIDVAASLSDSQAARSREVCARDRARCQALTFDIQPVLAKLFLIQKVSGAAAPVVAGQAPAPIAVDQDRIPELESLLSLPRHSRVLVIAGLIVAFVLSVSTQLSPRLQFRWRQSLIAPRGGQATIGAGRKLAQAIELDDGNWQPMDEPHPLALAWGKLYAGMHFFLMGVAPGLIGLGLATHPHWEFRGLPMGLLFDWHVIGMERALTEIPFWFVLPALLIAIFVVVYGFFAVLAIMNLLVSFATKSGVWAGVRVFWSPRNQWAVTKRLKRFLPTLGLIELELVMLHWIMGMSENTNWRIGWSILLIAAPTVFHFHRQILRTVGWLAALPVLLLIAIVLKVMLRREVKQMIESAHPDREGRKTRLYDWVISRLFHHPPRTTPEPADNRQAKLEQIWESSSS